MPQLQVGDFAPQLIWLAITFIGLYLILARVALPQIENSIVRRHGHIRADLDQAESLRLETQAAIAAYDEALAAARAQANSIGQKARDELSAEVERERAALEKELAEKIAGAEQRISESRDQALRHINEIAADTAAALVERLIGAKVAEKEAVGAVAKILK
jgi:F-type H+-transporting ATPase subunit b